jgi:hypothetical protein
VVLFSETHRKHRENAFYFKLSDLSGFWGRKYFAVRKDIVGDLIDMASLVSIEATRASILIDKKHNFAADYKSPGHTWIDGNITELITFTHNSILTGDLNANCLFWNSALSNLSGDKL